MRRRHRGESRSRSRAVSPSRSRCERGANMAAAIDDIRVRLADRNLLRDRCYVAGKGPAAADGRTVPATDLSTGKGMATVASLRLEEARRATAAAKRALPVWRAKTASERAAISRPLVRARYGPRRRSRLQRDARAGEAARGGQRRDCVRHLVRRMVRQEGQACLRRRDPAKGRLAADPRLDTTVSLGTSRTRCSPAMVRRGSPPAARSLSGRRPPRRFRGLALASSPSAPVSLLMYSTS